MTLWSVVVIQLTTSRPSWRSRLTGAAGAPSSVEVVTGSFSAIGYDPEDPQRPGHEDDVFYPFDEVLPYARTKVQVEHEVLKACVEGLDALVATSCAILGPNDYKPSRMGLTLVDYSHGRLRAYPPGGFDFVAARDLAFELVRKDLYILGSNLAGLAVGGTTGDLCTKHRELVTPILQDVLAIDEARLGAELPRESLIECAFLDFAKDPEHATMGRTAADRLGRTLGRAEKYGVDVPALRRISARG